MMKSREKKMARKADLKKMEKEIMKKDRKEDNRMYERKHKKGKK